MYFFEIKNDFLIGGRKYIDPLIKTLDSKKSKLNGENELKILFLNSQDAYEVIKEFQINGY